MASILRIPPFLLPSPSRTQLPPRPRILQPSRFAPLGLSQRWRRQQQPDFSVLSSFSSIRHLPPVSAASGETTETEEELQQHEPEYQPESAQLHEDNEDEVKVEECASDDSIADLEGGTVSTVMASLQSFKEALANDDQSTVSDIESFLLSIEDKKESLAKKISLLSEELSVEKDKILRISADFDNFRKRTEKERLSLMENVQGEVVESLLPVLDNFERAKAQIKIETEGEEKINTNYQKIYTQFTEILDSLHVKAVETVGSAFDPMLHEAIMQEESTEFVEGIILLEFRKGFKLGDRLLRPAMVKVSAGPGPSKPIEEESIEEESSE